MLKQMEGKVIYEFEQVIRDIHTPYKVWGRFSKTAMITGQHDHNWAYIETAKLMARDAVMSCCHHSPKIDQYIELMQAISEYNYKADLNSFFEYLRDAKETCLK